MVLSAEMLEMFDLVSSIMTCIKVLIGDQRNTYPHNSGGGGSILYISIRRAVGGAC